MIEPTQHLKSFLWEHKEQQANKSSRLKYNLHNLRLLRLFEVCVPRKRQLYNWS